MGARTIEVCERAAILGGVWLLYGFRAQFRARSLVPETTCGWVRGMRSCCVKFHFCVRGDVDSWGKRRACRPVDFELRSVCYIGTSAVRFVLPFCFVLFIV